LEILTIKDFAMIEQLKAEIESIERILANKKADLAKMIAGDSLSSNNKLIVLVEMKDQFSGITEVLLIDDNEMAIKEIKDNYNNQVLYCFEAKIFRSEKVKEDLEYLKLMLSYGSGQDELYEWMEENKSSEVVQE
jgi:hypothetical protein